LQVGTFIDILLIESISKTLVKLCFYPRLENFNLN